MSDVAIVPSKRLRNKIAGYTTHLMKRIQQGPVRGISLKLQEEVIYYYFIFLIMK